jgi:hypothetical protein
MILCLCRNEMTLGSRSLVKNAMNRLKPTEEKSSGDPVMALHAVSYNADLINSQLIPQPDPFDFFFWPPAKSRKTVF